MDEKKSFFDSLQPKSAMIVGVTAGFLSLCTIGFFVLLGLVVSGKVNTVTAVDKNGEVATNDVAPAAQDNPAPQPAAAVKSDKPKVELFVMSYCPFGLQMQKALLPAMELLKNKADISVKFVSYAMHGLKEIEENTRQYCIQATAVQKYPAYLKCFTAKDDFASCLGVAGVGALDIKPCVDNINKQFSIMEKYNDQKTWLSGRFPLYPPHDALNQQYGVQGSPTLVINGTQVNAARTPESVKQAICASFNNPPSECQKTLSNEQTSSGFGTGTGGGGAAAGCVTQ